MADTYFDHAATSFPKSEAVVAATLDYLKNRAGNPGRGGHSLAIAAAQTIINTRMQAAAVFGHDNPERVLLLASATHGLNLAIAGTKRTVEHIVTSTIEHNALARPVNKAASLGTDITRIDARADGAIDPDRIAAAASSTEASATMIAVTAGSNVLGCRIDIAAIRKAVGPGPLLCVDAAQTAGSESLDMGESGIDLLAIPGHKAIGGPQGIGLLLCSDRVELEPLIEGGTGGNSEPDRTPDLFPDGFEAGTNNGPGIAGLGAALKDIQARDLEQCAQQKHELWRQLTEELQNLDSIEILSCLDPDRALPLVSFRSRKIPTADLAFRLSREFGYAVRAGLHCAPDAHRTAGSLESGLVRASIGPDHTSDDIHSFTRAVQQIISSESGG